MRCVLDREGHVDSARGQGGEVFPEDKISEQPSHGNVTVNVLETTELTDAGAKEVPGCIRSEQSTQENERRGKLANVSRRFVIENLSNSKIN